MTTVVVRPGRGNRTRTPRYTYGDNIGYAQAHRRLGKAREHDCALCGQPAKNWAYDHQDPGEKYEARNGRLMAYSVNPIHYQPLCLSCHSKRDARPILT